MSLEVADDLEQIAGLRITSGAQHSHQALRGFIYQPAEFLKPDGGVDEVAQDGLTGVQVAGEQAFDSFRQQGFTKGRFSVNAFSDGFLEISCQDH